MGKTLEMARAAWAQAGEGWVAPGWFDDRVKAFAAFEALVRADERSTIAKFFDDHWRETWTDAQAADAIRAMGDAK
jgi:hypothetical protein